MRYDPTFLGYSKLMVTTLKMLLIITVRCSSVLTPSAGPRDNPDFVVSLNVENNRRTRYCISILVLLIRFLVS